MYLVIGIVLAFIVSFWKDNKFVESSIIFIIPHFKLFLSILPFFIKWIRECSVSFLCICLCLTSFFCFFLSGIF